MKATLCIVLTLSLLALATPLLAAAGQGDDAQDTAALALAERIQERGANEGRVGRMHFLLTDKRGRERRRSALLIHAEDQEAVRIAIQFQEPRALRDTGFLSHDFEAEGDRNWLYLPVTRRVRRLPDADRGDPFMGTDLSYGDIKSDFKFELADWDFYTPELAAESGLLLLAGKAKDEKVARELGYGRFEAQIDPDTLFPKRLRYFDERGEPLKALEILKQGKVGNAWTALHFRVENLQTGHQTDVQLEDMRYVSALDPYFLTADALEAGTATLADVAGAAE